MPNHEITFPDGKILFLLPEKESMDDAVANKLAAVRPYESGRDFGAASVYLLLTGKSTVNQIRALGGFQLIFDTESRKVVLEGEHLLSQTSMNGRVIGRNIMSRVEGPFEYLSIVELYSACRSPEYPINYVRSPITLWIDGTETCSKMTNVAHDLLLSPLPQFRFLFPSIGECLSEQVFYQGESHTQNVFQAAAVAGGLIGRREFNVLETDQLF